MRKTLQYSKSKYLRDFTFVIGPVVNILLAIDFLQYLDEFCEVVMSTDNTALIIANKNKEQLERLLYNIILYHGKAILLLK